MAIQGDEHRHRPQARQARTKVKRMSGFDDELLQAAVFVAVVLLTIVALAVAAAT
jgi:hypothetical protein